MKSSVVLPANRYQAGQGTLISQQIASMIYCSYPMDFPSFLTSEFTWRFVQLIPFPKVLSHVLSSVSTFSVDCSFSAAFGVKSKIVVPHMLSWTFPWALHIYPWNMSWLYIMKTFNTLSQREEYWTVHICTNCKALSHMWSRFILTILWGMGFPDCSGDKGSTCNAGDSVSIPGLGRSPGVGDGNEFQYSCLENSMARGTWWATVPGSSLGRIQGIPSGWMASAREKEREREKDTWDQPW